MTCEDLRVPHPGRPANRVSPGLSGLRVLPHASPLLPLPPPTQFPPWRKSYVNEAPRAGAPQHGGSFRAPSEKAPSPKSSPQSPDLPPHLDLKTL